MATRYDLTVRALDVVGVAGVVTVTCQLCDSDHDPVVGYTDDGEIVDRYSGYTDSDGELTLSLVANSAITPANTYYSLRVGSRRFLIEKGTSTQTVQQALAGSPAELASALALGQLSDVDTTGVTDGQVLSYDDDSDEWVPAASDPAMGGDLSGVASNAQIVAGAVGTDEIAAGAVTAAKVAADVATQAELDVKVAKTGDTMTGDLVIGAAGGGAVQFAGSAGGTPDIEVSHYGVARTMSIRGLSAGQVNQVWESFGGPVVVGTARYGGTPGAPSQTLTGEVLGSFYFYGGNELGWPAACAAIHAEPLEDVTAAAHGGQLGLFTVPVGGSSFERRLVVQSTDVTAHPEDDAPISLRADGSIELTETSTPDAPAANVGRLFLRDQAGETELCVRLASGNVRVLASTAGQTATESDPGTVELATTAETETGASSTLVPPVSATEATYVKRSLIDAAGDLVVGTANDTPGRLAVGTVGQVLRSDGSAPAWAAPQVGTPVVSGRVGVSHYGLTVADNASYTQSLLVYTPYLVSVGGTIDRLQIYHVGVPTASVVGRLGIYSTGSDGYPGALVVDGGTVDLSTAGGVIKEVVVNQALASGTLYWLAFVMQGGTGPTLRRWSSFHRGVVQVPSASASVAAPLFAYAAYRQNSVTGALPANRGTIAGVLDFAPVIQLRGA